MNEMEIVFKTPWTFSWLVLSNSIQWKRVLLLKAGTHQTDTKEQVLWSPDREVSSHRLRSGKKWHLNTRHRLVITIWEHYFSIPADGVWYLNKKNSTTRLYNQAEFTVITQVTLNAEICVFSHSNLISVFTGIIRHWSFSCRKGKETHKEKPH